LLKKEKVSQGKCGKYPQTGTGGSFRDQLTGTKAALRAGGPASPVPLTCSNIFSPAAGHSDNHTVTTPQWWSPTWFSSSFLSFLFFSFPSLSQFKVPSLLFEFQSVYINNKTIIRELAILAARKSIRLLRLAFAHNYLPALRGVGVLDGRIKA
jgi:hypothetical protein